MRSEAQGVQPGMGTLHSSPGNSTRRMEPGLRTTDFGSMALLAPFSREPAISPPGVVETPAGGCEVCFVVETDG